MLSVIVKGQYEGLHSCKIDLKISPIAAGSCEEQAKMILNCVKKRYPGKKIFVEIWEDNENGARVEE